MAMGPGKFLELDKEQDEKIIQYQFSRPPPKSYLDPPPASTPPTEGNNNSVSIHHHHTSNSFDTTRTNGSLSSHSFGTAGSGYRSLFRQNRSRSSTLMTTQTTPTPTPTPALAPTPVPRKNTFVDELASSQHEVISAGGGVKCEEIEVQMSPISQIHNQYHDHDHDQYPAPWAKKKKGRIWGLFKRWRVREELDFAARYEIWVNRKEKGRK